MTGVKGSYGAAVAVLALFHLWLAAYLPPAPDELYYWTWAQSLQASYYDHPPMVALWIAISTGIFGDNLVAIRLPAILASTAILLLLGLLVRRKRLLYLLLLSPMVLWFLVIMTPDVPLIFFWMLYLFWMIRLNEAYRNWGDDPVTRVYRRMPVSWGMWAVGGLLLGLGFLSKYTMALAAPCLLLMLALNYRPTAWLGGFLLQALVAGLVALPVLLYNMETGFLPLKFQWAHSLGSQGVSLSRFWEFVGVQAILVSGLPFLLFPWVLARAGRLCALPVYQAQFYLYALPLTFFLFQAMRSRLEANWPLVAYLSFWPLAQMFFEYSSFRLLNRGLLALAYVPAITASALMGIHLFSPLSAIAPERDRLNRLRVNYTASRLVARDYRKLGTGAPLFAPSYQWTAYLRFQGVPTEQIQPGGRLSHYTMTPRPVCNEPAAVALIDVSHPEPALTCFPHRRVLREYPLIVRGKRTQVLQLVRYSHAPEGS